MVKIKKGLDIPISGSPEDNISDFKKPRSVALLGSDYHGLKPSMLVSEGEEVKLGQPIFTDKKNPGIFLLLQEEERLNLLIGEKEDLYNQ